MELIFIRHGQTDVNKSNRIQGSSLDPELNSVGRSQAEKAAANFNEDGIDRVFSSPMKRAIETAQIITKDKQDIAKDKRLMEFDYGEWDGQVLSEMKVKYPDAIDPWGKANGNYVKYAPHGETMAQLNKRCGEFIDELLEKYPDEKILVVAHGTLIRMMAAHLVADGNIDAFQTMDNVAGAKFSIRQGINRLVYYNRIFA